MFKKINIFYWVQFCCFSGFFKRLPLTKFWSDKKIRTVFEHSRFIFAATLSVDRNAIKLFQFVMNKDWLLFFYPGKNLYFSIYSYSKPYLCLTVEKNGIKCWIFSRAETFSHTSSRHIEMEMVAMMTCHVNLNLEFDWLISCFGPGYQFW